MAPVVDIFLRWQTDINSWLWNPSAWVKHLQVGHTTAVTVALDTGCATFQNNTFLGLVPWMNALGPNDVCCLQATQSGCWCITMKWRWRYRQLFIFVLLLWRRSEIATIRAKTARHVRMCSHDIWNIDRELVGTDSMAARYSTVLYPPPLDWAVAQIVAPVRQILTWKTL
jgi:hypothetical protein